MMYPTRSTGPVNGTHFVRLRCGAEFLARIRHDASPDLVYVEIVDPVDLPFYGVGPTVIEALRDLEIALLETRETLERESTRLGPWPARQLRALRHLLEPPVPPRHASNAHILVHESDSTDAGSFERPTA